MDSLVCRADRAWPARWLDTEAVIRPQTDDYPEHLERAVTALVAGDTRRANDAIHEIAAPRRLVAKRAEPSETVIAGVYRRDRFCCRYCGCRVIPTQVMRLVASLFPDDFPYHTNWKGGETHPAFTSRSATLDHIFPWARGGTNDVGNLACACWVCNQVKGELTLDQIGWELRPIDEHETWDGLTGNYPKLWELAHKPSVGDHVLWMRLYA
jgi:5-methylcytosine-specific restriction endonuclease McrA